MRVQGFGPEATAADIRALSAPPPGDVESDVRAILDEVRSGGDAAVRRLTERFDRAEVAPDQLAVPPPRSRPRSTRCRPRCWQGWAPRSPTCAPPRRPSCVSPLPSSWAEGQSVGARRGAGAPGRGVRARRPRRVPVDGRDVRDQRRRGRGRAGRVRPAGPRGPRAPAILAACGLCDVTEVYRMGGAQAIAALAYGTESVRAGRRDRRPRQRLGDRGQAPGGGHVGIDGLAGPSELVVVASAGADGELVALDLLAQAEHGRQPRGRDLARRAAARRDRRGSGDARA